MGTRQAVAVVIDTNVILSGLLFGGDPGRLIAYWKNGKIQPYITKDIVEELLRVLSYPKFGLTEKEIEYLLYSEILPYFKIKSVKSGPILIKADPSDDKFLYCAAAAKAGAIISGDKHLLKLKSYQGIAIFTPRMFLKKYFGSEIKN